MDDKRKSGQQQGKDSAGQQQQQQGGTGNVYGEGNYKATRDYNEGLKEHVENHDIEREARDAEPRTDEERQQMEEAEREGRSRSKGEGRTN